MRQHGGATLSTSGSDALAGEQVPDHTEREQLHGGDEQHRSENQRLDVTGAAAIEYRVGEAFHAGRDFVGVRVQVLRMIGQRFRIVRRSKRRAIVRSSAVKSSRHL